SALAGEGHDHRVTAATAREVSEAVLENAATQVRLVLVDDELGQSAGLLGSLTGARPVLGDDLVEQRLLWLPALVAILALRRACRGDRPQDVVLGRRGLVLQDSGVISGVAELRATHPQDHVHTPSGV